MSGAKFNAFVKNWIAFGRPGDAANILDICVEGVDVIGEFGDEFIEESLALLVLQSIEPADFEVCLFEKLTGGVILDVDLDRVYIDEPKRGHKGPGVLKIGHLFTRDHFARFVLHHLLSIRVERGGFFKELQGFVPVLVFLVLQAELDERFGILGILGPRQREGRESIDALEDAEDSSLESLRRRIVARDPVYLRSVCTKKKKEGSAADVEFLV